MQYAVGSRKKAVGRRSAARVNCLPPAVDCLLSTAYCRLRLDPVSVADFLGPRSLAMAGAMRGRRGLGGAQVGDHLHELGVADGFLLVGQRYHAAIEAIELEARELEAELLHSMLHGVP